MPERTDDEGMVEGNFDQIRIYDAPVVAMTQLVDGELSWRSFRDTFLDPASLSASERDTITGRMKRSLGNNPISNTFIDVATNPFVLFMFATSPAGGAALKSGGRVFTGLAKKAKVAEGAGRGKEYMEYLVGNYSPLRMAHLLNAHQLGAGTPLTSVLHEVTARLDDLTSADTLQMRPAIVKALQRISAKFGSSVDSLDPSKAPAVFTNIDGEMVSAKEYLKRFNTYAYAHMAGMTKQVKRAQSTLSQHNILEFKVGDKIKQVDLERDQAVRISDLLSKRSATIADSNVAGTKDIDIRIAHYLARLKKPLPSGAEIQGVRTSETSKGFIALGKGKQPLNVMTKEMISEPLDPNGLATKWLEKEGLIDLMSQTRNRMKIRYADMFLKGGAKALAEGKLVYDDAKLLRIFGSLSDAARVNNYKASEFLVREVFGGVDDALRNKLIKGFKDKVIDFKGFKKMLVDVRSKDDIDNFMSRNVWSFVYEDGRKIRVDSANLSRSKKAAEISNRTMERQLRDPIMDVEDLERIKILYKQKGITSPHLDKTIENTTKIVQGRLKAGVENRRVQVMNLDYLTSFNKYMHSTRNDLALFIDEVGDSSRQAFKDFNFDESKLLSPSKAQKEQFKLRGAASRFNAIEGIAKAIRNSETPGSTHSYDYIMNSMVERIQGNVPMKDYLSEWSSASAKNVASWITNSKFMKEVEKTGGSAQKFIHSLRQFADDPLTESSSSRFGRTLTKVLYASHLGFNLPSATLNLFQPLMFATSTMGPKAMIKGYSEGLNQYFSYIEKRLGLGFNADPIKVDELRKRVFRLSNVELSNGSTSDLLDIRKNAFELLDSEAFAGAASNTKPGLQFWAFDLPLKLFQHSEIFNRVVTGEAMLAASRAAGVINKVGPGKLGTVLRGVDKASNLRTVDNIRQVVQNTQFGSDLVNSPAVFQTTGFGLPWVRQFFSFPLRTLTAWTDTSAMINQGKRTWGVTGFETQGRFSSMMHDLTRMMGTSAIVYEAGKNLLGADLSRGLSGQTLYESTIVAPMLLEGKDKLAYHLPIPPAGDIIMDAANALTSEDVSVLGAALPRFVPGGVGLSRLLNIAPRVTTQQGWLGGLQKESADWGAMNAQGQIPIYRPDGSLLEYRSAAKTVLGGLGFNSYVQKNDQELNQFLVKNRQGVVDERRKYVDAVLSNDMGKANGIKIQFEKRFKFPLSVTKVQMDRAIQMREVPLKERMYSRISPEMRPQVRPFLAERLETLKSRTPEELDLSTAKKASLLPSTFQTYDPYSVTQ
jgi:hypothetical protein